MSNASPDVSRHWSVHAALSALLVGAFAFAAWGQLGSGAAPSLTDLADLAVYALVTLLLVVNVWRRPAALDVDVRFRAWVVSLASYGYYLLFESGDAFAWVVLLHLLADSSLIYLGTSFSVLPARRAIRVGWLYRVVRHPAYAAYVLGDAAYCVAVPTPRNVVVAIVGALLLGYRARLEERVLARDPAYRDYQLVTRYRFFPGIY